MANLQKNKLKIIKTLIKSGSFISFLVFSFASYSQWNPVENSEHTRNIQETVRKQVWRVNISGVPGGGTGFFISPNQFITNFHGLPIVVKEGKKIPDMFLSQEGNSQTIQVTKLLNFSALYDLALLEVSSSVDTYLTPRAYPLAIDETVFVSGYPKGKFTEITGTRKIESLQYKYNNVLSGDYPRLSGASGSPAFDQQGRLIGVLYKTSSKAVFLVSLNDLQNFIEEDIILDCHDLSACLKEEINKLKQLAKEGNIQAQLQLANLYKTGIGVNKNYGNYVYWYIQAAQQGDPSAQMVLATIYTTGQGVEKDFNKAFYWYEQAAVQGYVEAQHQLGNTYHLGRGVEQDFNKAFYWYEQAAVQGYTIAQHNLGFMYSQGKGVEQDFEQAFYWYEQAAVQGYTTAQEHLGFMYSQGIGVEQDFEQAFYWCQQAVVIHGHTGAPRCLYSLIMEQK